MVTFCGPSMVNCRVTLPITKIILFKNVLFKMQCEYERCLFVCSESPLFGNACIAF